MSRHNKRSSLKLRPDAEIVRIPRRARAVRVLQRAETLMIIFNRTFSSTRIQAQRQILE